MSAPKAEEPRSRNQCLLLHLQARVLNSTSPHVFNSSASIDGSIANTSTGATQFSPSGCPLQPPPSSLTRTLQSLHHHHSPGLRRASTIITRRDSADPTTVIPRRDSAEPPPSSLAGTPQSLHRHHSPGLCRASILVRVLLRSRANRIYTDVYEKICYGNWLI